MLRLPAFRRSRSNGYPLRQILGLALLTTRSFHVPVEVAPYLVDETAAPADYDHSAVVYEGIISDAEHDSLVSDFSAKLKRRRYERGHWDAVIVKYKETELFDEESVLSPQSRTALDRIRSHIQERHFDSPTPSVRWLPCHVIDYHANGELNAHVDSVRFSGATVSGLSLLSPAIMRLRPAPDVEELDRGDTDGYHVTVPARSDSSGHVDLLLPPRSLYVLSRASRYKYTHELLPNHSTFKGSVTPVARSHRMSVIFRDARPDD